MIEAIRQIGANRAANVLAATLVLGAGAVAEASTAEAYTISTQVEQPQMETMPVRHSNDLDYETYIDESRERADDLKIRRVNGVLNTVTENGVSFSFECDAIMDGWVTALQKSHTKKGVTPFNVSIGYPETCANGKISKKEAREAKEDFRDILGTYGRA